MHIRAIELLMTKATDEVFVMKINIINRLGRRGDGRNNNQQMPTVRHYFPITVRRKNMWEIDAR